MNNMTNTTFEIVFTLKQVTELLLRPMDNQK